MCGMANGVVCGSARYGRLSFKQLQDVVDKPMKALEMVILSHMRSLISRPESGWAIALTTVAMSVPMVRFMSSPKPGGGHGGFLLTSQSQYLQGLNIRKAKI